MNEDEKRVDAEELDDIREQLEHNTKLLEQNNRIMRKLQSSMRRSAFFRMLYWTLIIGSLFGLYYYLQPYIDTVTGAYDELISIPNKLKVWENPL